MTTTLNAQFNYVRRNNGGMDLEGDAFSGPGMTADSLTSLYTTRGTLDLNLARLPTLNDCTVRPSDPLVQYDAFVVSAAGTAFSGVTGITTLNVGDLLVIGTSGDPTVGATWMGVVNTALELPIAANSSAYNGQKPYVRVLNARLPFFP